LYLFTRQYLLTVLLNFRSLKNIEKQDFWKIVFYELGQNLVIQLRISIKCREISSNIGEKSTNEQYSLTLVQKISEISILKILRVTDILW